MLGVGSSGGITKKPQKSRFLSLHLHGPPQWSCTSFRIHNAVFFFSKATSNCPSVTPQNQIDDQQCWACKHKISVTHSRSRGQIQCEMYKPEAHEKSGHLQEEISV